MLQFNLHLVLFLTQLSQKSPKSLNLTELVIKPGNGFFTPNSSGEVINASGYATNEVYPDEYYANLSEMIIADLGGDLLRVNGID